MTDYAYTEHPKSCDPKDFWGQVKRTVNGKPVSQDQIDMIVQASLDGLAVSHDDVLLDLCCGNGALSTLIFTHCQGGVGVDISDYLIDVAKREFEKIPREVYVFEDVMDYIERDKDSERFTKVLCYGAFSYFSNDKAEKLFETLFSRYPYVTQVYLGNLPDKDHMKDFYREGEYIEGIENDPKSAIGVWRSREEMEALAEKTGWRASFFKMPEAFYASHYRYDVILKRNG